MYSNKDIEKYRVQSDGNGATTERPEAKKAREQRPAKEEREKEYWCKRATPYRKKIERTREEITHTEQELSDNSSSNRKRHKALGRTLEGDKKKLKRAEEDLADLENEAYRKGIPMGWLRCQFE